MALNQTQQAALTTILNIPLVQRVLAVLNDQGGEARVVGGVVRDALLAGRLTADCPDIDMAMNIPPDIAMAALRKDGLKVLPTGIDHGTITVFDKKDHRQKIELTTLRYDTATDGRHAEVAFTQDWAGDAARRDFTINAIYLDGDGTIFDPCHGLDDLRSGIVRFIGRAEDRIQEDHLRMLRFFRFQARFGQTDPDQEAMAAIATLASSLDQISGERQAMELARLLPLGFSAGLQSLVATGVDHILVPSGFNLEAMAALSSLPSAGDPASSGAELPRHLPLAAAYAVLVAPEEWDRLSDRLRLSQKLRRQTAYMASPIPKAEDLASDQWQQKAWREKPHPEAAPADLAWRYAVNQCKQDLSRQDGAEQDGAKQDGGKQDLSKQVGAIDPNHFFRLATWQPPEFPVKGQDLLAMGIPQGALVGRHLQTLEDLWVASGFSLNRDDLLAQLAP